MTDAIREQLARRVNELEQENAALAAHVEALQEKQIAETCACSHDSATDVCLGHSPMLRAERERAEALAVRVERFHELANVANLLDADDVCEQLVAIDDEAPTISLACLKAEWQAEALERAAKFATDMNLPAWNWMVNEARRLRRQAEQAGGE